MRKDLVESFQLASQNHELDYFRTLLEDLAKQRAEYLAQKEAGKAKKGKDPAKKIYLRMGSGRDDDNDTEDAEDDQESTNTANEVDVDADDFADSDGKTKKRKKEVDSDSDTPRSTKRSKVSKSKSSTRLKLPMAKTDPASKAPSAGRSKGGKSSKQSPSNRHGYQLTRPTARSSDDEQVTTPLDPAEEKEKQILFLRHRLQKGFLTKEKIPSSSVSISSILTPVAF